MLAEMWKEIPGLEGYYSASNLGRVRSECRKVKRGDGFLRVKQRMLSVHIHRTNGGSFLAHVGDTQKTMSVHRSVALAFIGPRPPGYEVRHLDGDVSNNALSNLVYGTKSENESDKLVHGTSNRGERNGQSKLTDKIVRMVRRSSRTNVSLAIELGVSDSTISMVRSKLRWGHVE